MADVLEKQAKYSGTNVTITTTTEKVIITSDPITVPFNTALILVKAWGELTTGTNTTGVAPAIRRGTTITDTLITEQNNQLITAAAAATQFFFIMGAEQVSNVTGLVYSFTLLQAGSDGNGTVLQAGIEVEVLSG